jgi:hypothetical protein
MAEAEWVATYRAWPGVYGGVVVVCLHCKAMTYYPAPKGIHEALSSKDVSHRYQCVAYLEWAIAQVVG